MSETDIYGPIIVAATELGDRAFRNNIGLAHYRSARGDKYSVPYGVGGEGGSDIIAWHSVTIMPEMVGSIIAQFTAIEVKPPGWKPPRVGSKARAHYEDQKRFIDAVIAAGGIGGFVTSVEEYRKLVGA